MDDQWRISKHDPEWKSLFNDIASKLRTSLGHLATRIHHVGSTSVSGLDAKPIIDIQISIISFDEILAYKTKIEQAGFVLREENPDRFREVPGTRRTHIQVRQAGSFSEQITLLFRDYLRVHPTDCVRYAQEKHQLMELYRDERSKYVERKGQIVWNILRKAHTWSQEVGWKPGISDM